MRMYLPDYTSFNEAAAKNAADSLVARRVYVVPHHREQRGRVARRVGGLREHSWLVIAMAASIFHEVSQQS
jgi:hypothetical protein